MSTKVTIHVCDEDMEYAHSMWDGANSVLSDVNEALKKLGVEVQFNLINHSEDDDYSDEWLKNRVEIDDQN